ncbi:P-loop containing nucleoside triphosphate hydrolase protein [Phakopsora pachyrhizi]|uniref:ATP-dependent RNA helicase n=1 Tax=Phakopsora pachyrhizi TaxID=170000 RepID=A0AAV0AN76_PHAPC|nr:P-loop containing nucleoside triphosphate hydrolase protein [Phakopsora pachyrhizi]
MLSLISKRAVGLSFGATVTSTFSIYSRALNSAATLQAKVLADDAAHVEHEPRVEPPEGVNKKPFSNIQSSISPLLYRAITQQPFNYTHMSPVQDSLLSNLPELLKIPGSAESETRDLMVKAKTGTGKTLAFLIPAIETRIRDIEAEEAQFKARNPDASHQDLILHMRRFVAETTGIVILSPTRELATQIAQEAVKLTSHIKQFGIRLFVGGASKNMQLREWDRGRRDIVVATPGRLNDVLETSHSVKNNLSTTRTLILDEADTLLEMGFKEEIDQIVSQLPAKEERSTYLFSATISPEISAIARKTMKSNPKIVDCVPQGETNVHAHIPQYYTILPTPEYQMTHIFNLIAHDQLLHPSGKTIIFLPTTKMTQLFGQILTSVRRHFPWNSTGLTRVYEMHGGRSQSEREGIARDFRGGKGGGYQILVTSDVSARGVDYPGVTRVIQIGVPTTRDIYVHRVGRTGRAGKSGRGDLVLLPFEANYVTNALYKLPIKPLGVSDLAGELTEMVKQIDESGKAPVVSQTFQLATISQSRNYSNQRSSQPLSSPTSVKEVKMELPVSKRLESLKENLNENILPMIGEEAIMDNFSALLGYYGGKGQDLNTTKDTILHGLKRWAMDAMKLAEEPYVSPTFLAKLGFNNNRHVQSGFRGRGGQGFQRNRGGGGQMRNGGGYVKRGDYSFGARESGYGNKNGFGIGNSEDRYDGQRRDQGDRDRRSRSNSWDNSRGGGRDGGRSSNNSFKNNWDRYSSA